MSNSVGPIKIAVLGGGIASLAAVFELTSDPDWQKQYEIDVYQIGWRLGGKGASGCNAEISDRIEEHGLHVWMGFYENSFDLIRRCYEELACDDSNHGHFLTDWERAFIPCEHVTWEESINGQKTFWRARYKASNEIPGTSKRLPNPLGCFLIMLPRLCKHWASMRHLSLPDNAGAFRKNGILAALTDGFTIAKYLAYRCCLALGAGRLADSISTRAQRNDVARRLWLITELTCTYLRGMVLDGVLASGFNAIDQYDFRQWLSKHKASSATIESSIVKGIYDFVFAYEGGDHNRPRISAAVAVRLTMRLLATSKGAVLYKMVSGMGESVFAPLYEVLRRRGVRFHFFHRIENLALGGDRRTVSSVTVTNQASIISNEYEPLVLHNGLKCWPTEPRYTQLKEGDALFRNRIDLESDSTAAHSTTRELTLGRDFDEIILGISIGALPHVCSELIAARQDWQEMIRHVRTVQTQAFQVWLNEDLDELGCPVPATIMTAFSNPFSTWSAMDHLLERESWRSGDSPQHIAYFCGPLIESNSDLVEKGAARGVSSASRCWSDLTEWYENNIQRLWPRAKSMRDGPEGKPALPDASRIYLRANGHPSDRYVLALPGSAKYRLASDESGFTNVYLAGDWVRTGLNLGCIEGAVISGLQVARAVTGRHKKRILGECDFQHRAPSGGGRQ